MFMKLGRYITNASDTKRFIIFISAAVIGSILGAIIAKLGGA